MNPRATEGDSPTTYEEISNARLVIEHSRGILCVYGSDGTPWLKITGLPKPLPDVAHPSRGHHELNIHVVTPDQARSETGYIAAIQPTTELRDNALLKHAGATLPPRNTEQH